MIANPPKPAARTSTARKSPRCGPLTLDIVRTEAEFYDLKPYWDALLDQSTTRTPFLRWDWVSLWWEECRGNAQLAIGLLRDVEGVPQAIAPLMFAHEKHGARQHLTSLTFLAGFGEAHGERLDLIVPAGREDELTPQLCRVFDSLRSECDNVRLNHLPEESPNTPHILAALRQGYNRAGVLNRHACHFIHLPATWDEYEHRHTASWRSKLRRHHKAFNSQHAGSGSLAGESLPIAKALDALHALHSLRWPTGVSTFTTTTSWRFHQRLAAKWLPQQRAVLPLLEANGQIVATMYGFIERDEFFQFQMGWHSDFARLSLGRLMLRWCIDYTIQLKLRVHDMLPGEYSYKRHWCDATRWLLDLEACNPASWRAITFHALRTVRRMLPHSHQTDTESNTLREDHDS